MIYTAGPSNARIMIVGEAVHPADLVRGMPFSGPPGFELMKMLQEAGISPTECFMTNVVQEPPPDNNMGEWLVDLVHAPKPDNPKYKNKKWVSWKGKWAHPAVPQGHDQLVKHIALVRPALVIALGNAALFALTGRWGIKSWRGSQLESVVAGHSFKVIPTYHPAAVQRDWSTRAITVHDLRRARKEVNKPLPYVRPNYPRIIRPSFAQVVEWFGKVRLKLLKGEVKSSTDIETRAGHTACTGFHIKGLPTLCIPWMCVERPDGYWTEDQELWIWRELRGIMTHPNFKVIGQNWFYDAQYKFRFWFIKVPAYFDTMLAEHCMFPGQPKGLDYLSSKYCEYYRYWKEDGKLWDPSIPEEQHWNYNCDDVEYTYEVYQAQESAILSNARLESVWRFQTHVLGPLVFNAMCRGIRADVGNKKRLSQELEVEIAKRQRRLDYVAGHPVRFRSPAQLKKFFYEDLRVQPIISRKGATKGKLTTDDEALSTIAKREPLLRGICNTIQELRSIGVFKSTFVEAKLDRDQRIRCSFNIGGTITFRLSSSENAFGSGLNLQNVPQGNDDPDPGDLELPNIRKLFIPDQGMVMFDIDLKNADFYTVVWEADDELFRQALEKGVDMHLLNAGTIFGIKELADMDRYITDPEFTGWAKKKYPKQRDFSKRWVHGTDFGGGDRTMAATVGITVAENKRYREKWFYEHPGIKAWHERTEQQINTLRYVENKFGYRYNIFDRPDLPEALAWVPQSTTGCVINRAWAEIDKRYSSEGLEVLLQVHDSLTGQFPAPLAERMLREIPDAAKVVVPYEKPLVIPVGMKMSAVSWGHCD
jgi:DNA polymerase I-like protein with 3'-5' exonuclease and polymerase domains/uracil-DNA glycosylase